MPIDRSIITTADISDIQIVAIEMVASRPTLDYMPQAGTPNAIVGYYDTASDTVELYVRDSSGHRVLKLV